MANEYKGIKGVPDKSVLNRLFRIDQTHNDSLRFFAGDPRQLRKVTKEAADVYARELREATEKYSEAGVELVEHAMPGLTKAVRAFALYELLAAEYVRSEAEDEHSEIVANGKLDDLVRTFAPIYERVARSNEDVERVYTRAKTAGLGTPASRIVTAKGVYRPC